MVKLGYEVIDPITGFEGTVTAIFLFLHGCRRIQVTPKLSDDGKWREHQTFDEPQLEIVSSRIYEPPEQPENGDEEEIEEKTEELKDEDLYTPTGGDKDDHSRVDPIVRIDPAR